MMNKVSVIIPVYNVENYLEDCLNSMMNQTLKEIEIIAINDGSTDNSYEILKRYNDKFPNIKILTQINSGLSATRNVGIDNSTGEYVIFIDSDDMLTENALNELYTFSKDNELDLTIYDALRVEEVTGKKDLNFYSRSHIFKDRTVIGKDEFMSGVIKKGMLHTPFHFYKRDYLVKNNFKFKEGLLHEDELFSMTSYQFLSRIGYISDQFYIRRYRENSIMNSNTYENMNSLSSYLTILTAFNSLIKENKENLSYCKLVKSRGSLIMCNLVRYKGFGIKKLVSLNGKEKFGINMPRVIYNVGKFKILRKIIR